MVSTAETRGWTECLQGSMMSQCNIEGKPTTMKPLAQSVQTREWVTGMNANQTAFKLDCTSFTQYAGQQGEGWWEVFAGRCSAAWGAQQA